MLSELHEEFQRWERYPSNEPSAVLIILPGSAFWKDGQTYRSDIRWMWKVLRGVMTPVSVGRDGFLSLFLTDEPNLYKPYRGEEIIRGSWDDATLMWFWIKYVTKHSWWKQKRGQLRQLFTDINLQDMLAILSTKMIEGETDGP